VSEQRETLPVDRLRTVAAELEKAALLIRLAARAARAGSPKAASEALQDAFKTLGRYGSAEDLAAELGLAVDVDNTA
jgi:hypothetical protein